MEKKVEQKPPTPEVKAPVVVKKPVKLPAKTLAPVATLAPAQLPLQPQLLHQYQHQLQLLRQ